jgi:hypothetical protein
MRDYHLVTLPSPSKSPITPSDPLIVAPEMVSVMSQIVGVLAQFYSEEAGIEIAHAELHLKDRHGRPLKPYAIPIDRSWVDQEATKESKSK